MQDISFLFILKPSAGKGVGVFAVQSIPKSLIVFPSWRNMVRRKLSEIPKNFHHFCIHINDEYVLCPWSFDNLSLDYYINHSFEPNIIINLQNQMVTCRDINPGEEILIDYNQYNEPEHLKSDYYKIKLEKSL